LSHDGTQGYFALSSNRIVIYSMQFDQVQAQIDSFRREDVIGIGARCTDTADYLIVVTRTSCCLYLLVE
jgi:hypothetical protein